MRKCKGLDTLVKKALEAVSSEHQWSADRSYAKFNYEAVGADSCSIDCLECSAILSVMLHPADGEPHVLVFDRQIVKDLEKWTLREKELVKDEPSSLD